MKANGRLERRSRHNATIGLNALEAMTLLSITIPDARRLIAAVELALSQPATNAT